MLRVSDVKRLKELEPDNTQPTNRLAASSIPKHSRLPRGESRDPPREACGGPGYDGASLDIRAPSLLNCGAFAHDAALCAEEAARDRAVTCSAC